MLRLPPFRYHRPDTVQDAVSLLAEYAETAIPVSGGTDLIPNMKHRLFTPAHLVALKGIGELKGIREEDRELVIGAAETLTDVWLHPSVRLHFTALAEAAGHVAGPQLRNSGTLGGQPLPRHPLHVLQPVPLLLEAGAGILPQEGRGYLSCH